MPAQLGSLSDEELILACRQAPPEQARALVGELAARHFEKVTVFIYGFVGDSAAAQDLAQEAFVRVYKHREDYRPLGRFTTWLHTIARNLALNELRSRGYRPQLALDRGGAEAGEGGALERLGAKAKDTGPLERAAREDLRAAIRREVEALPPNHRAVVVLCDIEQRSYAEAAELLEVPIGTVRSRLSRAREQLAARLTRFLGDEP